VIGGGGVCARCRTSRVAQRQGLEQIVDVRIRISRRFIIVVRAQQQGLEQGIRRWIRSLAIDAQGTYTGCKQLVKRVANGHVQRWMHEHVVVTLLHEAIRMR
jgi:hypothetical protein